MIKKSTLVALIALPIASTYVIAGSGSVAPTGDNIGGAKFTANVEHSTGGCRKIFVQLDVGGGCSIPSIPKGWDNYGGCGQSASASGQVTMDPGGQAACTVYFGWTDKGTAKSNYGSGSTTSLDDHSILIRVKQSIHIDTSNIKNTSIGRVGVQDVQINAKATTADLDAGNRTDTGTDLTYSSETPSVCTVGVGSGLVKHVGVIGSYDATNLGECRIKITGSRNQQSALNDNFSSTLPENYVGWNVTDVIDTDSDGIADLAPDNCAHVPNGAAEQAVEQAKADANGKPLKSIYLSQNDMDGDGVGDVCDENIDGDTYPVDVLAEDNVTVLHHAGDDILNDDDNCPIKSNGDQIPSAIGGIGAACIDDDTDLDSDGVLNTLDNCPQKANDNQSNIDEASGDTLGDVCDADMDGDTVDNVLDNCPETPNEFQDDKNNNGQGDACESKFVKVGGQAAPCGSSWGAACFSIQDALDAAANENPVISQVYIARGSYSPSSTINLKAGVDIYGGFVGSEIYKNQSNPVANETIISGGGTLATVVSATNLGAVNGDDVKIDGLTFSAAAGNALLVNNSMVKVSRSVFKNNTGSAVKAITSAGLTLDGVSFTTNTGVEGSALYLDGATTTALVSLVEFTGNTASNNAAAIFQNAGALTINNSVFKDNVSNADSGALKLVDGTTEISESLFLGNKAKSGSAGAINNAGAVLTVIDSEFNANTATADGGALLLSGASSIMKSLFILNEAANGGAADINGNVTAENLTFYGNKASSNGGALNVSSGASILSHVSIVGNIASTAGAVYAGAGTVELNRSLVAGNAGGNIHGTSVTFLDGDFNLVGFNDAAEISGGASLTGAASFTPTATPDAKDAAVKYFAITLEEIVDPSPNFKGGDGYQSMLKTLPLKVASIARNKIPKEECISAVDQRGETRPDYKDKKCDIGAYEYAVLTCAEDAQRRYEQGEIFVKSCAPKFEDFEFGSINQFMLSFLALMGLMSLMRVPRSK